MIAGTTARGHLPWMLLPAYTFSLLAVAAAITGTIQTSRRRQEPFEKRPPTR